MGVGALQMDYHDLVRLPIRASRIVNFCRRKRTQSSKWWYCHFPY